jgi:starch-binding outer membrane protein, SusD/RagB family
MMFMKKILIALVAGCLLMACGDYLDVVPDNVATIDYAFRNRTAAEKYLYTCYSYRPPIGSVNTDPAMNGGDETWQRYTTLEAFFPTFPNTYIARGQQSLTNPILNFWNGQNSGKPLWTGIRDCNIFLEKIGEVHDLTESERTRWIAEVKFLKAYYHYYLMKCFGPIPVVDKNLPISAGTEEVKVYRQPIDTVVNYIANLMTEAAAGLPDASGVIEGTEAGRVDKLAAITMRAEVLLFAASPLFNGNTDYASMIDKRGVQLFPQAYDPNKWKVAADACKQAIDLCHAQGKALYTQVDPLVSAAADVFKQQVRYRQAICDRWNSELIWGSTNYDCNYLTRNATARILRLSADRLNDVGAEWAPTLKMAQKYYSSNGVPIEEDKEWQAQSWYVNRFKIRPEVSAGNDVYYVKAGERTVYLHYNREPRFYASLGFDKGIYFGNGYYNFPADVKYCDFLNFGFSGYQGGSGYSATGYSAKKMHSFKNAQTANATSVEYFPFPILRLADLYLMYAEALNEADGSAEEVLSYVDQVRARAGLEGVRASWAAYSSRPDKPDSKDGRREIIHQERTIELAFEGKRFWDIRRWKQIDVLNDQPMGWNIKAEEPEDFYRAVPVAQEAVEFSVKDYFWPIRESDIIVNNNLIQNYGW